MENYFEEGNCLRSLGLNFFQNILGKLRDVEQELEAIGENMKQLEISAEKAQEREEKLTDKIHLLMERLKIAEARFEYGEMNVSKLNLR
jgi:predicted  nucleic acid-binding Zn-ribbon protein